MSAGLLSVLDWIGTYAFVVEAVGMWESRSDFQGRWERWETATQFATASTARHFHSFRRGLLMRSFARCAGTTPAWPSACPAPLPCRTGHRLAPAVGLL